MTTPLENSILHWADNVAAEMPDGASLRASKCALCLAHYEYGCMGCPVAIHTDRVRCAGTPYSAAAEAHETWLEDPRSPIAKAAFRDAAQVELDFLKSLRPKETT